MSTKTSQSEMQKVPKLRFAGFEGEWEEKKLGEVATFLKGKGISKDDISEDGKNKCIRYGELYTTYSEIINEVKSKTNISEDESLLSKRDDILIPSSGETALDIATVSCVKEDNILLGGDLNVMRLEEKYYGNFFAYYLSNFQDKQIAELAQGNSVVHLYSSSLKTLKVNIPPLPEQQKVALFLGGVEEWIVNLRAQKESFESYKKGMMQKIFSQVIRFKDGKGNEFPKWEEKKLKEVLKERKEYSTKGKDYPHISLTIKGVVPKSERYDRDFLVSDDGIKEYKITRLNDLCYNPANLKFGTISINKLGAGIFSPIYITFEILNHNIDFVGYYLIRDAFISKARRYEQGTVYERMAVHPSDFLKVRVAFPSLPEQQKIADFLTSVDKVLESKQQQITQAEQWKKGLMQGLFV